MKDFQRQFHNVSDSVLDEYLSAWNVYELPANTIITAPIETEKLFILCSRGYSKNPTKCFI